MCEYCEVKYYVQVKRLMKPLLAPLTHIGELQNELIDLTGIEYMQTPIKYCPMCGRNLLEKENK